MSSSSIKQEGEPLTNNVLTSMSVGKYTTIIRDMKWEF